MKYLLLHQTHGAPDVKLLKEGDADEIQAFLTAKGCQDASHYRVICVTGECPVRARAALLPPLAFWTAQP